MGTLKPELRLDNLNYDWYNLNFSADFEFDFNITLKDQHFSDLFDSSQIIREWIDGLYGSNKPMTVTLIVLYSIAFTLGLFGNLFVISVVAYYRHMRTSINIFLVNLAVGDLLVVFICIPITLSNYIYRDYVFGQVICKLVPFIQGASVGVSSLSLLVISTNRYFAIHKPMRAKMSFSKQKVYIMIIVVWITSFIVFIPLVVVNNVTVAEIPGVLKQRYCTEKWMNLNERHIYNIVVFLILFIIPLVAMVCTYSRIGVTLWRGQTSFIQVSSSVFQAKRILLQRRRSVRMLVVVAALFVICWLPYYCVNIWLDFNVTADSSKFILDYIYPLVQILGFCNSTVNPICYCFMSTGFRRVLLKCCFRRRLNNTRAKSTMLTVRFKTSDSSLFNSKEKYTVKLEHV